MSANANGLLVGGGGMENGAQKSRCIMLRIRHNEVLVRVVSHNMAQEGYTHNRIGASVRLAPCS